MKINHFKPHSSNVLLSEYKEIRAANPERDESYSPLFDAIMDAIYHNLFNYAQHAECTWTNSFFPERLSKEILRIFEQQIIIKESCQIS